MGKKIITTNKNYLYDNLLYMVLKISILHGVPLFQMKRDESDAQQESKSYNAIEHQYIGYLSEHTDQLNGNRKTHISHPLPLPT